MGHPPVQAGTANYADPRAVERLARGLESRCRSHQVEGVSSLTRALEVQRTRTTPKATRDS